VHEGSLKLGISGKPHFGNEADGPTFDLRDSEPSGYHISNVVFLKERGEQTTLEVKFLEKPLLRVGSECVFLCEGGHLGGISRAESVEDDLRVSRLKDTYHWLVAGDLEPS
jgi:hypothetical protein